jgi:dienelactone hydrolase
VPTLVEVERDPDTNLAPIAQRVRQSENLKATPVWFGPVDRPLFGWLQLPEEAHAGVVLCRPIGLEALSVHRAYRRLAEKLVGEGMVTLLFDYTGTGDSAGDLEDLADTSTWVSDIGEAIEYVRQAGVSHVGLIGLRLGATLAANATADYEVDALVLWDPCETGRAFLREQRLLAATIGASPEDPAAAGGVEIPGLLLPKNLAAAISALSLDNSAGALAQRLLLLTRPGRFSSARLQNRLSAHNVEQRDATGQDRFIDVEPGISVMPEEVVGDIVTWSSRSLDSAGVTTSVLTQPESWSVVCVARSESGGNVIERAVEIGAEKLFGVVTELQDAGRAPRPAVIFLNAGVCPHSGPARLWVDMARLWAIQGVRALRLDIGGLGDSPTRPGQRSDVAFPPEAIEDIRAAVQFMAPEDPSAVVLVGLSSGGYHGLEGALLLNSRRAWLVNPGWPRVPPEATEADGPHQRAARLLNPLIRRLLSSDRIARLNAEIVPSVAWWALDKLGLYPTPARTLENVAQRGTELLVVYGEPDYSWFTKRSSRWGMRRLERSGRCRLEVVQSMDHSLFNFAGRSELMRLFSAEVLDKLVPDSRPDPPSDRGELTKF